MLKRVTKFFGIVAAIYLFALFAFPGQVLAQSQPLGNLGLEYQANIGLGTTPLLDIVAGIINAMFGLLGTVAVCLILYAGFLYMTSAGEADKVDKAKKLMVNAAIGLAIILAAYSIAAFIVNFLLKATLGGGSRFGGASGSGYEAGSGALGGGIIQSHFPKRNAVDVPRNTMMVVTFKESVKIDQIIRDGVTTGESTTGSLVSPLVTIPGVFEISSDSTDNAGNKASVTVDGKTIVKNVVPNVNVTTPDGGKTFVFKPVDFLGNTKAPSVYTVAIKCALLKANLTSAFGTYCNADGNGYKWSFQVSTKLDLVPPTITSVIPRFENASTVAGVATKTNARNIIVQVNFSEPVNPAASSGQTAGGFSNIFGENILSPIFKLKVPAVTASPTLTLTPEAMAALPASGTVKIINGTGVVDVAYYKGKDVASNTLTGVTGIDSPHNAEEDVQLAYINGRYEISNGYQTVEFTTDVICGVNSCGNDVYCLPGNANLSFTVKSPALEDTAGVQPFLANGLDGIVDMASNGLDGDRNKLVSPAGTFNDNQPYDAASNKGDSYKWSFFTNDKVDLVPPTVSSYGPLAGQKAVDPSTAILANFDKLMSSSSVLPDSNYGDGYCKCDPSKTGAQSECNAGETCSTVKGYCVDSAKSERVACYTYLPTTCKLNRNELVYSPVSKTSVATEVTKKIEDVCSQQEHVTVDQSAITDTTQTTWYLPGTLNSIDEVNYDQSYSTVDVGHGQFMENKNYGLNYGSGLKDLFQNCYVPNAAPGCQRLPIAGKPGEYGPGTWPAGSLDNPKLNYPYCNLSVSALATIGKFNLSYQTAKGRNKVQDFSVVSWDKDASLIYVSNTLGDGFDFFNDAFKPNTATITLYHDKDGEGTGRYYLIAFVQKPTPFVTALANRVEMTGTEIFAQSTAGLPVPSTGETVQLNLNYSTVLSKPAVSGATEIFVQASAGLPSTATDVTVTSAEGVVRGTFHYTGKVPSENKLTGVMEPSVALSAGDTVKYVNVITYSGNDKAANKLTGVTGLTVAHDPGDAIEWIESGDFTFKVGPLPANSRIIYPTVSSITDVAGVDTMYTATLSWDGSETDAVILEMNKPSASVLLNLKFSEISTSRGDMNLQFMYAGGSVALPNNQNFQIIDFPPIVPTP